MELREEVSHLVTLLHAVFELVSLNQFDVVTLPLKIVSNLRSDVLHVHGRVEFDDDWLTDASL